MVSLQALPKGLVPDRESVYSGCLGATENKWELCSLLCNQRTCRTTDIRERKRLQTPKKKRSTANLSNWEITWTKLENMHPQKSVVRPPEFPARLAGDDLTLYKTSPWRLGAGDFPGGPVVKNPPCNAKNVGLIPGQGTKILHAMEQLSSRATTKIQYAQLRPDRVKFKKIAFKKD